MPSPQTEQRLPLLKRFLKWDKLKMSMKIFKLFLRLGILTVLVWVIWNFHFKKEAPMPPAKVEQPVQTSAELDEIDHLNQLTTFFARYKCSDPDGDIAGNYLEYAREYNIDWRLLPAISVQESSCGKHQLYNNWWGFGSSGGLVRFKNIFYGMDYVMAKLTMPPYQDKTIEEILQIYGPHPNGWPSPTYYKSVLKLMNQIGNKD